MLILVRNALVNTAYEGYIGTIDFTLTNSLPTPVQESMWSKMAIATFKENPHPQ